MDISKKDEKRTQQAPLVSPVITAKDVEEMYIKKLKDLQQRNKDLQNDTNKHFASAVKQVEDNFRGIMPQPVCQEFQAQVLKCYQENPTDILNCSSLVNAFTACVNRARVDQTLFHIQEAKVLEVLRKIADDNAAYQTQEE
ncbi:hypothetical protein BsWGS_11659 [Bradybaena similaris]